METPDVALEGAGAVAPLMTPYMVWDGPLTSSGASPVATVRSSTKKAPPVQPNDMSKSLGACRNIGMGVRSGWKTEGFRAALVWN